MKHYLIFVVVIFVMVAQGCSKHEQTTGDRITLENYDVGLSLPKSWQLQGNTEEDELRIRPSPENKHLPRTAIMEVSAGSTGFYGTQAGPAGVPMNVDDEFATWIQLLGLKRHIVKTGTGAVSSGQKYRFAVLERKANEDMVKKDIEDNVKGLSSGSSVCQVFCIVNCKSKSIKLWTRGPQKYADDLESLSRQIFNSITFIKREREVL
jgi:hypothetical protein